MRTLEVWLYDEPIGTITETRQGGRFAYNENVVRRIPGRPALSLSLPAKSRPFGEAKTENWFNGLLPEGRRRDEICAELGLNTYDWIGLLAEIGWECAGAVRIFAPGAEKTRKPALEPLSEDDLAQRLRALQATRSLIPQSSYRMSLGGFQEKLVVALPRLGITGQTLHAGQMTAFLPEGDAASTHILKPESTQNYPGSAEAEAWAMTVASSAARCSTVALLELEQAPLTLVVERYDRTGETWPEGAVRVHQEDACQALGIPTSRKYANEREPKGDDPTYRGIAELLLRFAAHPEEELQELLRQITVNMALGNLDAHAKNTAFLFREPMVPALAPLYDVVPITEIEPRTTMLSMRIDGSLDPSRVTVSTLVAEAAGWGMDAAEATRCIDGCLSALEEGFERAALCFPAAAARHEAPARARIAHIRKG